MRNQNSKIFYAVASEPHITLENVITKYNRVRNARKTSVQKYIVYNYANDPMVFMG